MNEAKRGRGRPKMIEGEARDTIFSIRLSIAERSLIQEATEKAGVDSASDWARDVLMAAVQEAK
jgi:uncharacterized protein (DUF1778 family)